MNTQMNTMLTVREAAGELGVTCQTVRNWIKAGKLKAIRFTSRTIRIEVSTFDKFRKEHRSDN